MGLVIAIAVAAFAVGAGSKSSKDVVICAAKKGGDLTLADKGKCAKGEKKLTIAKQGPAGAVGPQGAPGPSGAPPALEAPHLVGPAIVACAVNTGTFCVTETGLCWNMGNAGGGLAPVSFRKDSDGFVHLEGAFTNFNPEGACGGGETRPVFYLPQGFRPVGGTQRFTVANCTGSKSSLVMIATNGLVSAGSEITNCMDLSGIVFHGDA
ncbi:MAG TPA: hypothetical protein VFB52_09800 [Solirubrobacterales bacterium]|nr:hypothetical protein [Solirubrobacterales bacterium]